jgi:hypothetical protein
MMGRLLEQGRQGCKAQGCFIILIVFGDRGSSNLRYLFWQRLPKIRDSSVGWTVPLSNTGAEAEATSFVAEGRCERLFLAAEA